MHSHNGWTFSKSRSALDEQTNWRGRRGRGEREGKGKDSETCELRIPKTRPVKILTVGFFHVIGKPIKIEQVNAEPRFRNS